MKHTIIKTQRLLRRVAISCVYQSLLLEEKIEDIVSRNFPTYHRVAYIEHLTLKLWKYRQTYITLIQQCLHHNWQFSRLSFLEQAILLVGVRELDLFPEKKKIIINEIINYSKLYCDENSYRYINAVLDKYEG